MLQMRRGIDHSTALSTHLQLSSILSEGTRISRKSLRLRGFLMSFSDFMIDFISQHNTDTYRRLLLSRLHRATANAAGEHFPKWRLTGDQLWAKLTEKVRRRIPNRNLKPGSINLILSILNSPFRDAKRKRSNLQTSDTIPDTPTQVTFDRLLPNTCCPTAVPFTPIIHHHNGKYQHPCPLLPDGIPDTPTYSPNQVPWKQHSPTAQLQTVVPDIPVNCSNIDAACEVEDTDSKIAELPSISTTPQ